MTPQQMMEALGAQQGRAFTPDYNYSYVFNFDAIAQGATQQQTVSVDLGTGFLVTEIAATARYAAGSSPTGIAPTAKILRNPTNLAGYAAGELILADIGMLSAKVTQTDRPWMSDFVPLDQCSGDAANPYILTTPILVTQKTDIIVEIENNLPALTGVAAPAVDVVYTLTGIKMRSSK